MLSVLLVVPFVDLRAMFFKYYLLILSADLIQTQVSSWKCKSIFWIQAPDRKSAPTRTTLTLRPAPNAIPAHWSPELTPTIDPHSLQPLHHMNLITPILLSTQQPLPTFHHPLHIILHPLLTIPNPNLQTQFMSILGVSNRLTSTSMPRPGVQVTHELVESYADDIPIGGFSLSF